VLNFILQALFQLAQHIYEKMEDPEPGKDPDRHQNEADPQQCECVHL
jgi:hypothetical protein